MKKSLIHNSLFMILFLFAFLERTVFDLGPNIELLTSAIILTSYFLNRKSVFLLTFLVIAFSDRFIGNSKIFLFTWSGFLFPALLIPKLFRNSKLEIRNSRWKIGILSATGVASNLFFYIYTNMGVWLLDSWGMYTRDLSGLIMCYINALPFLKNQIVSSLVFIPLGYYAIQLSGKLISANVFNKFRTPQILPKD